MNERLEQLKAEKARLEQTLSEVNVLIQAYEQSLRDKKNEKAGE